jgi:sphingomyelin phosphodiesterase acid-like 3
MKRMWMAGVLRGAAGLSVLAGCLAATVAAAQMGAGQQEKPKRMQASGVQALFVSDIHYEPFWDPAKVEKLADAPVSEWKAILAAPEPADRERKFAELQSTCHARGEDTSEALLKSSLRAMREDASRAKFVIVSGDLMAHAFSCKYATLFPNAAPGAYRSFAEKTVEYVIESLRAALPGVPVYAALGNNDSDCTDYQLDAGGKFLDDEGREFTRGFSAADRQQAARTFAEGGYYTVRLPAPMERTRLLVMDDLFMSRRYETCGGKEDSAPAAAQIAWLEQELNAARTRHEKVWVMAHIPPGVDAYSTAAKGKDICAGNKPTMFLSSEALPELMAKYGDVIKLAIFAHTHMDEMRLLKAANEGAGQDGVAVKMVPSISPIDGNNPAFTVATIDPLTATMMDYRVIAAADKTDGNAKWAEEYDFKETYKEPDFSAATLQDLVGRFEADRSAQTSESQSYIHNYDVGEPMRALKLFWPLYVCSVKNDEADAFDQCVCGAK